MLSNDKSSEKINVKLHIKYQSKIGFECEIEC